MKTITISIKPPNCFGNQSPTNKQCSSCVFCFDCAEKRNDQSSQKRD